MESSQPPIAPRDSLEFQLTQMWEKALSRNNIGVRDDFFENGGHSLSAVRLVAQIKKAFGLTVPLASLFQAPTVEQLAVLLREKGWSAPDYSALVAIQPAGSRPPFFCLPGGGGNLFGMHQIARHLGEDQPFYGLQTPALTAGPAFSRVEDIANHYLKEIRNLQPEGPYYLGGLCFGGLVALEIAQQLQAQGQQVALLILIDTSPSPDPHVMSATRWSNVRMHKENLALLGMKEKGRYLIERVKRKVSLSSKRLACTVCLKAGKIPAMLRQQYVFDADVQAQKTYVAQPYNGRLTLFWGSQDIVSRYYESYCEAWNRIARDGIETYDLPSDHIGIFREPHVRILAQRLKMCIDAALSHQTRSAMHGENSARMLWAS